MGEIKGGVLITGGARRLGAAIARAAAGMGFDVAIHCQASVDAAEALAEELRTMGRRAAVVRADLAVEPDTERVIAAAGVALGPIAVLVNNAAVFELDRLATADRESWDRHLDINLRAPIVLTQRFVAQLPPDRSGLVVNMIDQRVVNLTPNYLSYSVSKVGLWGATQVLARELAPRVRVNAIGPGPVLPSPGLDEARFGVLCRATPLQRGPSPAEIAGAFRLIVESPSLTGQLIVLDGGQSLGWLTPGAPVID